jgi:hypothetical protein
MGRALLISIAAVAILAGSAAASHDAGPLKRALDAKLAFEIADRYRERMFDTGARAEPCATRPEWGGRYLCPVVVPADGDDPERRYPIWAYEQRGHACVFDPSEEPGEGGQCVPPRNRPATRRTVAEFKVAAANGYTLRAKRFDRGLTLTVSRGPNSSAEYVLAAEGPPGRARIVADVPDLVEIDVGFRGTSRTTKFPETGCWWTVSRHTRGLFVGTIRFEGEAGYTRVDARRARGTFIDRVRSRCRPKPRRAGASARGGIAETVEVGAESSTAQTRIDFGAAKGPYPLFAPYDLDVRNRRFYYAEMFENGKAVDITRKVQALGPPGWFKLNAARTWAEVSPPAPFNGTATLTQERPSFLADPEPTWAGDLRVTFPGAPDVPLVGPGFEAHLHATG